jgi:hypothetical protein
LRRPAHKVAVSWTPEKAMLSRCFSLLMVLSGLAAAQGPASNASASLAPNGLPGNRFAVKSVLALDFATPPSLPRMTPDLALQVYQARTALQRDQMVACSSVTLIHAELPDVSQRGEFELQRQYAAPRTLRFTALHSSGDGFVKSNVIPRLLQSEQDRVQKGDAALTEISTQNYKFSYQSTTHAGGRLVYAYEVKPRAKRFGLFRGRIYVDAFKGSLVRAEGTAVKLASFFLKKAEFVQDYADFGNFTFPVHLHSEVRARFVGHALVDVYERDYRTVSTTPKTPPPAFGMEPISSPIQRPPTTSVEPISSLPGTGGPGRNPSPVQS